MIVVECCYYPYDIHAGWSTPVGLGVAADFQPLPWLVMADRARKHRSVSREMSEVDITNRRLRGPNAVRAREWWRSNGCSGADNVNARVRGPHNDTLDGAVARHWQVGKEAVCLGPAGA